MVRNKDKPEPEPPPSLEQDDNSISSAEDDDDSQWIDDVLHATINEPPPVIHHLRYKPSTMRKTTPFTESTYADSDFRLLHKGHNTWSIQDSTSPLPNNNDLCEHADLPSIINTIKNNNYTSKYNTVNATFYKAQSDSGANRSVTNNKDILEC